MYTYATLDQIYHIKSRLLDTVAASRISIMNLRKKTLMFVFHSNYINLKYGDKAKLLYSDTNLLM